MAPSGAYCSRLRCSCSKPPVPIMRPVAVEVAGAVMEEANLRLRGCAAQQFLLCNDGNPERLGLGELRPRILPSQDGAGALGDAVGDVSARRLDQPGGGVARQGGEGSRD